MNPQQPDAPVSYNTSSGSGGSRLATLVLSILLVLALIFAAWSFIKMLDYKNNANDKIAAAVKAASADAAAKQKTADDQQNKQPYKSYTGSPTYGSISFNYPKIWSAYVDTTNSSEPINGYFHPGEVPATSGKTAFALRIELLNQDYSQVLQQYDSNVSGGTVKAQAYVPPKLKGVANVSAGTYLSGQVNQSDNTQNGYMVIIKVRDKTLKIYTLSNDYLDDFNNIVLPSLTFAP